MPFRRFKAPFRLAMAGLRVFAPKYAKIVDEHTEDAVQGVRGMTEIVRTQRALPEQDLKELKSAVDELLRVAQDPPK